MTRAGIGWDSHRLEAGRRLVLGGVEIPGAELGLAGFSDADVLTHAVIDALLGAAGMGDIGQHFPDTDERWRDADSIELLRAVSAMLDEAGVSPPTWTPRWRARSRSWRLPRRYARAPGRGDRRGARCGEREVHDRRANGLRGPRRGHRRAGDSDAR